MDEILVNFWLDPDYSEGGSFIVKGAKKFPDVDEVLKERVPDYCFADYWDLSKYPDMRENQEIVDLNA